MGQKKYIYEVRRYRASYRSTILTYLSSSRTNPWLNTGRTLRSTLSRTRRSPCTRIVYFSSPRAPRYLRRSASQYEETSSTCLAPSSVRLLPSSFVPFLTLSQDNGFPCYNTKRHPPYDHALSLHLILPFPMSFHLYSRPPPMALHISTSRLAFFYAIRRYTNRTSS